MRVFNTITRKKEEFKPINNNHINMYVCGPTVYDLFHIGNARTFVVFDVVRRYFEYRGYTVKFVQNFTDIDDKIINKANENDEDISKVSEKYIGEYYKDSENLHIKRATINPKATENINEMIFLIDELVKNDYAYESNGDVYFNISSFKEYGKLFGQDIKTLKAGSRIQINKDKKDPLDFILWKKAKDGEPYYESPWGNGRPGWHTECCAMIGKYFKGETIDIHGGGFDLIFPHHENEIAQREVLSNKPLANYWMHCSFLNINKEKMSKSLGNFFTTREIIEKYSSNILRFFLLSSHYRNELYFSEDQLVWSNKSLSRIFNAYKFLDSYEEESKVDNIKERRYVDDINKFKDKFIERMDDDFNTSDGISVIFEFVKFINAYGDNFTEEDRVYAKNIFNEFFSVLGIEFEEDNQCRELSEEVREMIKTRWECKRERDFSSADKIRDSLLSLGIVLEDIPKGVRVINSKDNGIIDTILY